MLLSRAVATNVVRIPSITRLAAMNAAQSGSSCSRTPSGWPASRPSSSRGTPSLASTGYVARAWPSSSWAIAAAATADSIVGALTAHSPYRRPSALLLSASEPTSEIIVAVAASTADGVALMRGSPPGSDCAARGSCGSRAARRRWRGPTRAPDPRRTRSPCRHDAAALRRPCGRTPPIRSRRPGSYDHPQPSHRRPRVGADAVLGPHRVPHHLYRHPVDVGVLEQRLADVVLDELGGRAPHGRAGDL